MKYFLSAGLILFVSFLFAQNRVDTIRCGNIIGYGELENGKKEGNWKYYDKLDGIKWHSLSGNYHEGKKTGEWIIISKGTSDYPEKRVVNYKNDLLDGPYLIYGREKILYCQGEYKNGLKNGEWNYYYNNGQYNWKTEFYNNGVPTGRWKIYPYPRSYWTGDMNANGRNGYWQRIDTVSWEDPNNPTTYLSQIVFIDSVKYLNGKKEGRWVEFEDGSPAFQIGNYVADKKEGSWVKYYLMDSLPAEVTMYKNGLREGYDSIWYNDTIAEIDFYSGDRMNGPQKLFSNGKLISQGNIIPNPQHNFNPVRHVWIDVPIDIEIDLIENGICSGQGYYYTEMGNTTQQIKDSIIQLLINTPYVPDSAYNYSALSFEETAREGYWVIFYDNGNKKEDGNYLPIVRDSSSWDSTNQTEDPNNPGTFIYAPIKIYTPIYSKTGWWKYYDEQGMMIREELYNEHGVLVETKNYGK